MSNSTNDKKYCSYCEHTGIVHNSHFNELGDVPISPCPKCVLSHCKCNAEEPYYYYNNGTVEECYCRNIRLKIDKINKIYERSGIDKKYRWKFLHEFDVKNNKLANEAKLKAYEIIKSFPHVKKGLFLWGNPGTGKTLLSTIILTEIINKHAVEGRFIKISRTFFNRLKATFVEGSETYGESSKIQKEFEEVDFLIIDDFGVQRDSAWEQETLYNLVDARYEAEKFTIFTSNNNPFQTLKGLSDGRVLSRIKEMCWILELSGKDHRDNL